jgi:hypothetical protein
VHARPSGLQHFRRQKARLDRPHHPAPRCAPKGLAASSLAKALAASTGSPRLEGTAAPATGGGHGLSSRSRTPGAPLPAMNLTPASLSARREAAKMARRGSDAPLSNWRRVTTPTSADRASSSWVQSMRARAARHWAGVIQQLYHFIVFRQLHLFPVSDVVIGEFGSPRSRDLTPVPPIDCDRLAGPAWLAEALEAQIVGFLCRPAPGDFLPKPLPGGRRPIGKPRGRSR